MKVKIKRKIIWTLYCIEIFSIIIIIILNIIEILFNPFKNGNYLNLIKNWKKNPIPSISISKSLNENNLISLFDFKGTPNYKQQKLYKWLNKNFAMTINENKNLDYIDFLLNYNHVIKELKQNKELNEKSYNYSLLFNKNYYNLYVDNLNKIFSNSKYKICGTDLSGNYIIYEKEKSCPINYISIGTTEPNVNFSYNTYKIDEYKKLFISNQNYLGNIVIDLKINNIEICCNSYKSDNLQILINSYKHKNKICEDENDDLTYSIFDTDMISNFLSSNNIKLNDGEYFTSGKINLYYRTYFSIRIYNNDLFDEHKLNLFIKSENLIKLLYIIKLILNIFILIILCISIVLFLQYIKYCYIIPIYFLLLIMDSLIIINIFILILTYYIYKTNENILKKVDINNIILNNFRSKYYIIIRNITIIFNLIMILIEIIQKILNNIKYKLVYPQSSHNITTNLKFPKLSTNINLGDSQLPIDIKKDFLKINNYIKTKDFSLNNSNKLN